MGNSHSCAFSSSNIADVWFVRKYPLHGSTGYFTFPQSTGIKQTLSKHFSFRQKLSVLSAVIRAMVVAFPQYFANYPKNNVTKDVLDLVMSWNEEKCWFQNDVSKPSSFSSSSASATISKMKELRPQASTKHASINCQCSASFSILLIQI